METRTLRYFLAVARAENISHAATRLHVSQPALSKQMKELEQQLGQKLFTRTGSGIRLTDAGQLLRKRAEDILAMVDKTEDEFRALDAVTGGDVYIGCAESYSIRLLADLIHDLRARYPGLRYHILSGDTGQVAERLDRGLLDLAVIVEPPDLQKYNHIALPNADTWGVVIRRDDPLAEKKTITAQDLIGLPLLSSAQSREADFPRWCGETLDKLTFVGSVNLFYNGTMFVRAGDACLLTFDRLARLDDDPELCFRPLAPTLETKMFVIWRKYQTFSPMAQALLDTLRDAFHQ